MFTLGSCFSGIGGFEYGLEMAGFKTQWQIENDPFCQKVLQKHWPDVPKFGDINEIKIENLKDVRVISGGYPCQPFSIAGKRKGECDDRHLWPKMFEIIQIKRPDWVICENVYGHVTMGLDQVLADLENEAYSCQTFIVPACAKNALHRRDRVWIIANSKSFHGEQCRPDAQKGVKFQKFRGCFRDNAQPRLRRVDDGIPLEMDRLKSLGNAIVPQIAYEIGMAIIKTEKALFSL